MQIWGVTNQGMVRSNNQDNFYIGEGWCMIADGMGGHNGGETASAMAVETAAAHLKEHPFDFDGIVPAANRAIFERAVNEKELAGMGTTIVLAHAPSPHMMRILHVGDSRAYKICRRGIFPLTRDHSVVEELIEQGTITREEAKTHPQRHFITRAVGTTPHVEAEICLADIAEGDMILLCTDGLTNMVSDREIYDIVMSEKPEEAPEKLVALANEHGGADNITAVLMLCGEQGGNA